MLRGRVPDARRRPRTQPRPRAAREAVVPADRDDVLAEERDECHAIVVVDGREVGDLASLSAALGPKKRKYTLSGERWLKKSRCAAASPGRMGRICTVAPSESTASTAQADG